MWSVLQLLLENLLFVKTEKCEFHSQSMSILGYIIAPGGIQIDPAKVSAILECPLPDSRNQLQHFLGFTNFYSNFIWNYSSLAGRQPHRH